MRRLFQALGLLILAVGALLAVLAISGYGIAHGKEDRALLPLRVRPEAALRGRGRHLAELSCVGCHSVGDSLPLAGGRDNFLRPPGLPALGELYAPNLTPGGEVARYGDAELGRAIREGLDARRQPMLVMPSDDFHGLSDRDLAALIAWLRAEPAIEHATPPRRLTLAAYLMLGMQALETSLQRPVITPVREIPQGPTAAYGEYLTRYLGCADCHGADFRGGRNPINPRGPDLQPIMMHAPREAFVRALRQGVGARGQTLDPVQMPWRVLRRLSDVEIAAVYEYLRRQTGAVRPGS
ncbi:MAG TPA: c-type cytochrome [Candidatus Eisenbacteria bacterium]